MKSKLKVGDRYFRLDIEEVYEVGVFKDDGVSLMYEVTATRYNEVYSVVEDDVETAYYSLTLQINDEYSNE